MQDLQKCIVAQLMNKFRAFMELDGSLLYSHWSYAELFESIVQLRTLFSAHFL